MTTLQQQQAQWRVDVLRHTADADGIVREVLVSMRLLTDEAAMGEEYCRLLADLGTDRYLRVTRLRAQAPPAAPRWGGYERDAPTAETVPPPAGSWGFAPGRQVAR